MVKNSYIEKTYVVGTQHTSMISYPTENKETYFEVYTYQVSCPLALAFLNSSNCQSVLKSVSLNCK